VSAVSPCSFRGLGSRRRRQDLKIL
jgi:hypothetical protein